MSFLSLSKCCIPTIGVRTLISDYVSAHKGLQGLDLSYNPFGTDEGTDSAGNSLGEGIFKTIALNLLVCFYLK